MGKESQGTRAAGPRSTMAFRACAADDRGYLVLLHREAPPTDDEWTAYLEGVRKQLAGATARVHAIVATDGGGPNANQRKQLAALLPKGEGTLLTHVFTTNVVVRGIVTAFHWLVRAGAVAHDPAEFASVCESLGLSPRAVLRELLEAQKALPPVAVLEAIAESMNPTSTTMKIR